MSCIGIKTHGLTKHPLYGIWSAMKRRCSAKKGKDYELYVKRGVKVCDEWENSFELFYNWAISNGYKKGMQLDKDSIPFKQGKEGLIYSPATCVFLSPKDNSNYRRNNVFISYNGANKNMTQWENELGLPEGIITQRINTLGWSIEKSLTTPVYDINKNIEKSVVMYKNGLSIRKISLELNMCRKTISTHFKNINIFK